MVSGCLSERFSLNSPSFLAAFQDSFLVSLSGEPVPFLH